MVIYKFFILLYVQNITGFQVKYSPPIEAGASFNPPNLAKDCILRASVSEAMGLRLTGNSSHRLRGGGLLAHSG